MTARWSTHTEINSGSRDTEVNELAVMPWTLPGSYSTVTTVMPVANWPRAWRKVSELAGVVTGGIVDDTIECDVAEGAGYPPGCFLQEIACKGTYEGISVRDTF